MWLRSDNVQNPGYEIGIRIGESEFIFDSLRLTHGRKIFWRRGANARYLRIYGSLRDLRFGVAVRCYRACDDKLVCSVFTALDISE